MRPDALERDTLRLGRRDAASLDELRRAPFLSGAKRCGFGLHKLLQL